MLIVLASVLLIEGYLTYRFYQSVPPPFDSASVENTDPGTPESTSEETTVREATSETSANPTVEAAFVHRATPQNSRGDFTYLEHPLTDGNPDALVLVTPRLEAEGVYNGPNIGVWYESDEQRWAIFNQDFTAIPEGATFNVVVIQGARPAVHRATGANTVSGSTFLDHPSANGNPDAVLIVTQNWNPGGGGGTYNDHPVVTSYDADRGRWALFNGDGAPVPPNTAYNVFVLEPDA